MLKNTVYSKPLILRMTLWLSEKMDRANPKLWSETEGFRAYHNQLKFLIFLNLKQLT